MPQPAPERGASGPELFARYAYPPNELGYCGPADPGGLLVRGSANAAAEIGRRARAFEGAWVYLELIAEAVGISDPLDARVVEAYWLGNELLETVDSRWFLDRLRDRLRGQVGGQWTGGIPDLAARVLPHHAFHVFAIYPWVGMLSVEPGNDVPRAILDQCRIRIGSVEAVSGPRARVSVRRLEWDGERLGVGEPELRDVRWSEQGRSMLDGVDVGDRVTVHWDWVCDVVSPGRAQALESYERRQLAVTNRVLAAARPASRADARA
jgi:Family of unknown function (DUF6390)